MSDSRRRSSRRGKKLESYSANDLVQIPHNSTTIIGRLLYKLTEQPSVRWLVAFDDVPSRKDEEIPEEAIGPVVGRLEAAPKAPDSTSNRNASNLVTPTMDDSNVASTITNNESVTTRSVRRKSNSGSNSSSSSDDSITKKKKKGNSLPASIPKEETDSRSEIAQEIPQLSPKISGRERRSRRRQGLVDEETQQGTLLPSSNAPIATTGAKVAPNAKTASVPPTEKRKTAQGNSSGKSRNDDAPRTKKGKFGPSHVRGNDEVLKVQFLTGTLYLYRGPKRHVEFIPKY